MNEDEKLPQEQNEEKKEDEIKKEPEFSLFDAPLPVVSRNDENNKEKSKKTKKVKKSKSEKKDKNGKYPNTVSFLLGFVVLIFACIGIVLIVWNSISYIRSTTDKGSEFEQYNSFLTPVAAVDPDPFDDIADADTEQLLNCAILAILGNDSTPDKYSYSGGYMMIPKADVESVYAAIFGKDSVSGIEHRTVNSYNCTFEYNESAMVYQIPVTAISPIYTPKVTAVEESGSSLIITVEYLAAESWQQDKEGNFVAPEPDKVMSVTLRESDGSYYISSIRTVSATIPDIVPTTQGAVVTEPESEVVTDSETTTGRREIATLAGRV